MRHHGPLLGSSLFDVAVDQRFQPASRLYREGSGNNQSGSERACLLSNRSGRSISIIPDLSGSEHDEQGKECAHRRQHAGGECPRPHPHAGRKFHDYRVDHDGAQVSTTEKHHRHPSDRQVMEPIAHYCSLAADGGRHGVPPSPDSFWFGVSPSRSDGNGREASRSAPATRTVIHVTVNARRLPCQSPLNHAVISVATTFAFPPYRSSSRRYCLESSASYPSRFSGR